MRERFQLQGALAGFFSSPRTVELQIYGDGTLTGFIPTHKDGDEQHTELETFLILDGTAVNAAQDGDSNTTVRVHSIRFQLVKRTDIPGLMYGIVVEGKLSRSSGLQGRWRFEADTNEASAREFDLPIQPQCLNEGLREMEQPSAHELRPLTQGSYTLKGAAIGDNGYLYQATWRLELREGGVLRGWSTEYDNAPQVSRVEGSWNCAGAHCTLFYEVDGVVGTYNYDGVAHSAALRGRWVNSEVADSAQERGKFEFVVVDASRRWNHSDHKHYPRSFRDTVWLCLLSSSQPSHVTGESAKAALRIPSNLWSEVFAYCGYHWFSAPHVVVL